MLSTWIQRLTAACGVAFRTIRAFLIQQIQVAAARVKNAFSLTEQAVKAAPSLLNAAAGVGKKPGRREDYIETKQLFISKAFLLTLVLTAAAAAVLAYFVAWPWLLSRFFTARIWCGDPRTADYTGRVILYHEKEKETVRFAGRLENGVIQGEGRGYDGKGLLVYSGSYADGVYSGEGRLYDDGTLIYAGTFADGLYDGRGSLYEKTGALLYEGGFSAGLRSGEGTAYLDGARLYKGTFSDDRYNGNGILYDPDGGICYRGSFLDGLYSGIGTLTLDGGAAVQAEFDQGEVIGDARCFLNGKLCYAGGMKRLVPDGVGTLYDASGRAMYHGPMKNGVIDGGALLRASAMDLREMLEDAAEQSYDQGFSIACEALGFAAFCSYARQDAHPMVCRVYLYAPEDSHSLTSSLWDDPDAFEALARTDDAERGEGSVVFPSFPLRLPLELDQELQCRPCLYDGYTLNVWSRRGEETPLLLEWRLEEELPQAAPADTAGAQPAKRMEDLIDRLGLLSDRLAAEPEVQPGGGEESQPDGGQKNGAALLRAVQGEDGVYPALTAALGYLENEEQRAAAQENLALYEMMADEEAALNDAGKGDPKRLSRLKEEMAALNVQIMQYTAQMRKEARTIEETTGLDAAEYDLLDLLVLFDVSELDMDALGSGIIAAAEEAARAEEETARGEEAPPADGEISVSPVDRKALLQALEDSVLDLELAYQNVGLAHRTYENALGGVEELDRQYAVGEASRAELLTAQITANTRRGSLYAAMAAFARRAALLNEASGGVLAGECGWLPDILAK